MRKVKEILRLKEEQRLSIRQIGQISGVSPVTVRNYLLRLHAAGLSWPLPAELTEAELEAQLFPGPLPPGPAGSRVKPEPDWQAVHQELRRKGVTLGLLWEEYKQGEPGGVQYSWFCEQYRAWASKLDVTLRQDHRGGEKAFVDYAGQTVRVYDRVLGEREAQIFLAVMGASNYTYTEATWTQKVMDWCESHRRAMEYFGGVPGAFVPDNLRSGVTKSNWYEPELNRTYEELAQHYGTVILPARVRKPRDKAKVEAGVLMVERWILARLRNRRFLSLEELNAELRRLMQALNERPFKKLPGCRRTLFEAVDRPALKALPEYRFEAGIWHKCRVGIDYHVEVERHYYSVPYVLAKEEVEAYGTARTVEVYAHGVRVASHLRSYAVGRHTTLAEHMPPKHRKYLEWTPDRLVNWAEKNGPQTANLVRTILASRQHAEQGYRSCLGVMRLGKTYGVDRLEAACDRALRLGAPSYSRVAHFLKKGLDRIPLPTAPPPDLPPISHENIRGAVYYQTVLGVAASQEVVPCPTVN